MFSKSHRKITYEYVVKEKPPIEWIINRHQFTKDRDS